MQRTTDHGQRTLCADFLWLYAVTDLFADAAATAQMFIYADIGTFLIILTVTECRAPELIQAPSAHVTFTGHPEDHLLLFAGDTFFE